MGGLVIIGLICGIIAGINRCRKEGSPPNVESRGFTLFDDLYD
jgi:hypothetical protein|tara:strand:+ start:1288 stop:1416 length:129 start_codon:yes stop_codon:yes gene_type:complete